MLDTNPGLKMFKFSCLFGPQILERLSVLTIYLTSYPVFCGEFGHFQSVGW